MSAQKFAAELELLAKKLDLAVGVVVTKIALDAHAKIVARTPVDTGRARASWAIKEGSPSDDVPPPGSYEIPAELQITEPFDGSKSVFITSALDYIRYLEDGSSKQAPAGMIAITLAELEAEAEFIINQP